MMTDHHDDDEHGLFEEDDNFPPVYFWLRPVEDSDFHAYLSHREGDLPVCGNRGAAIRNLQTMDTGASWSRCCLGCFREIYGFPAPLPNNHTDSDSGHYKHRRPGGKG